MKQPIRPEIMLEIRLPQVETDSDSQEAYDVLYSQTDISQHHSFYLWLMDVLKLQPGEQYLDISCGRGQLVELARQQGSVGHGLDLSHTALKLSHRERRIKNLVTANSQVLPYASDVFDVVSNIGSLEHYVDMKTAVQEMARVLKPNGRCIVLVPNTFSLLTNIWIAFREGRTSIDHQPIQRYGSRQEWHYLLEDNGLVVDKTLKYERERPRTWADWKDYLRHPKTMLRWLLTPLIPLNLIFCFVFIAHKREL